MREETRRVCRLTVSGEEYTFATLEKALDLSPRAGWAQIVQALECVVADLVDTAIPEGLLEGRCPRCGQPAEFRQDGKIKSHARWRPADYSVPEEEICPASGRLPKDVARDAGRGWA